MGVLARSFYSQTIDVEPYQSRDGQGQPSYGSKTTGVSARISEGGEFEADQDGARVLLDAVAYVPAGESQMPAERDRITHDSTTYIVRRVDKGIGRDGSLDHLKLGLEED